MSEPLIARRCPSCGVAIREQALFCPQCGKQLHEGQTDFSATIVESAPREIEKSDTADLTNAEVAPPPAVTPPPAPPKSRKAALPQTLGKMGAGVHKAAHAARGVEGNVVQRVQKLRDVSSVVIDEAAYDPSLRFVLVAVALFVLFLVMLVLSKVIT